MKAADGMLRNRTAGATSSGKPQRRIGVRSSMGFALAASACKAAVSGVLIQPGAIAFTRMLSVAQAAARLFVSCTMPPFDA